jgi:hypothetical protein
MTKHTKAYLAFKTEAERLANFVALVSHAVPVLRRVIAQPSVASQIPLKPADNFPHDRSTEETLDSWAKGYDAELARLVVLATFSYFEAYVKGVLGEIFELQGGAPQFIAHATKRVTRNWGAPSPEIAGAKGKLQKPDNKSRAERARKFTRILEKEGYRFPSEILAVYGAKQLQLRIDPKSRQEVKAAGIPDLLSDALLLQVTKAQRQLFDELRMLRNDIAHGALPSVTVQDAIKTTTALRKWAVRIDEYVVQHFFVLEKYAE